MKARQRAKKFTAVILTLAMLLTMLPVQVFAYIPGRDTEAGFKKDVYKRQILSLAIPRHPHSPETLDLVGTLILLKQGLNCLLYTSNITYSDNGRQIFGVFGSLLATHMLVQLIISLVILISGLVICFLLAFSKKQ